jgi:phage terminase small subunit
MSNELTPKQERFCQKYIETGNATEAYKLSYDAENMKNITCNRRAKELLDNSKITARVRELQAIHQHRHEVTVDSLTEELEEARLLALQERQASPMVSASMGKAKLHGLIVEKNEHTGKDGGPMVMQTKEQRDAAVAAALAADS